MSARVHYRLSTTEGMTISTARPADADDEPFRVAAFGVVHVEDSMTGKRGGDVTVYPWHTVESFTRFRTAK